MERALALVFGYLLGSFSPAWLLGRTLRHIDIREHGFGTTGTANAFRVLGAGPGLLSALVNAGKGLLAMLVARLMGLSPPFILASGAAAALGHLLPFYLRFRGGEGTTVCAALLGVNLFFLVSDHPFPWHVNLLLGLCVAAVLFITRQPVMLGITAVPLLGWALVRYVPASPLWWYSLGLLAFLLGTSALHIRRGRLMSRTDSARRKMKLWRFLIRPAAMAFPVLLVVAGRTFTLVLLGVVTAVFLAMDVARLSAGRINLFLFRRAKNTFKQAERTRLSSMTGFLLASLVVMLVFDATVTWYAMAFLVFGDFAAKYFGLQYGRTRLFRKTLEGSLAHLLACLAVGTIINSWLPLGIEVVALGALAATVLEVLPLGVDDNLTVGILGATALHLGRDLFG